MIKNQKVNIKYHNNLSMYEIITLQNRSTPGIYYKFNVENDTHYKIIYTGFNQNKNYLVTLWIADIIRKPLLFDINNSLSNNKETNEFYIYNKNYNKILIGFLFNFKQNFKTNNNFFIEEIILEKVNIENYKNNIFYNLSNNSIVKQNEFIFSNMMNFIKKNQITQINISNSLLNFKDRTMKKFNLMDYDNKTTPCIFFGIYDNKDFQAIRNHIGDIYIMPGGSDLMNYKRIKKTNVTFIAISKDIYLRFLTQNIYSVLVEFNLVDRDLFKPVNTVGNKIYIYDGCRKNVSPLIYGKKYYDEVVKQLPQDEYIFSSKLNNISYEKMPEIYAQCFIGLRLTSKDGNANTVQEMEAMGIPVVHNQSEYGLKWTTSSDVVDYINNIKYIKYVKYYMLNKKKYNFYSINNLNDSILNDVYSNIDLFDNIINDYKNILFICGDYPGYGGAAINCDRLQKHYKQRGHNTFAFYYNFEKGKNAKYEKTNDYIINNINYIKDINFNPDLIILKSFINYNLKQQFNCPVYYLVGGIYKGSLNRYHNTFITKQEHDKYINYAVINQIKNCTHAFVNSSHTQEILKKYYNLDSYLFYSSFINHYKKQITHDNNFDNRKYDYGLIVSNFERPIKNINESLNYLKDKKEKNKIIFIGKNSDKYKKYGFTCIDLVDHNKIIDYYKEIKYIVQNSFYESCSNVKIEGIFNGCKIEPIIVISSTQYPGFGGAATNAYNLIKYFRDKKYRVAGLFFNNDLNVNYDPEKIGGIFLYDYNYLNNRNKIKYDLIRYLKKYPTICLAKNYVAPYICKQLLNIKIIYLVSGIRYFLYDSSISANTLLKDNFKINNLYYNDPSTKKEILSIVSSDMIIVNSLLTLNIFKKIYPNYSNKIYKNYIDTSNMVLNKSDINNNDNNVNKDYDILICCSKMDRKQKNISLINTILNDNQCKKYKKIIIGKNSKKYCSNLTNTDYFDLIEQKKCIEYMKRSKIILIPSLFDSNPNTSKEAIMSNCIPIITKNIGCYEKYPEDLICKNFDKKEWVDKIIFLLDNYKKYINITKKIIFNDENKYITNILY